MRLWLCERVGLQIPESQVRDVSDCLQQKYDSVDCGVLMMMFAEILTRGSSRPLRDVFKDALLYRSWVAAKILFHGYCVSYKEFWLWYEKNMSVSKD